MEIGLGGSEPPALEEASTDIEPEKQAVFVEFAGGVAVVDGLVSAAQARSHSHTVVSVEAVAGTGPGVE